MEITEIENAVRHESYHMAAAYLRGVTCESVNFIWDDECAADCIFDFGDKADWRISDAIISVAPILAGEELSPCDVGGISSTMLACARLIVKAKQAEIHREAKRIQTEILNVFLDGRRGMLLNPLNSPITEPCIA